MRISFSELALLLDDPEGWADQRNSNASRPRWGYKRATVCGIYKLHKTNNLADAQRYLTGLMDGVHLKNGDRRAIAEDNLNAYAAWTTSAGLLAIACRKNVKMSLDADTYISGEINRIDLDSKTGGYRVVMLGDDASVLDHPRTALLQRAAGRAMGRDESLISSGVQLLDGSKLQVRRFTKREINRVEKEIAKALAEASQFLG